jgi:hypothetical protein
MLTTERAATQRQSPSSEVAGRGGQRPKIVIWALVTLVTAWTAVILSGSFGPSGIRSSPLLLSVPFLAVVAIGATIFFAVADRLAARELRRSIAFELKLARAQGDRIITLSARNKQHSERGASGAAEAADPSTDA